MLRFAALLLVLPSASGKDHVFVGMDNEVISVGDNVVWETGDGQIPAGSIGQAKRIDTRGPKLIAAFRGGVKKKLLPTEVRKLPTFAIGDQVTWSHSDRQVPAGTIGKVMRFDSKNFTVVTFRGVRKHLNPIELRHLPKLNKGDKVAWDASAQKGSKTLGDHAVGEVDRIDAKGHAVVKFRGGKREHIAPDGLRKIAKSLNVGDDVTWSEADSGVPRGAVGQIQRFDSKGLAVVKYRGGLKRHVSVGALTQVSMVTVGDEVVWTGADAETPRGSVGTVMRIDSKGAAFVAFKGKRRRLPMGELRRPAIS